MTSSQESQSTAESSFESNPDEAPRTVFVHGSGRAGKDAWPHQASWDNSIFLTRPGYGPDEIPIETDFDTESRKVNESARHGANVIAHSFGAVAVIIAASHPDTAIKSMVLIEPAAFSLSRGTPAVEAHIAAVGPVFENASNMTPADFMVAFLKSLGVPNVEVPTSDDDLTQARRNQLLRPPWEAQLDSSIFSRIPTLVLSGRWNAEYEEVADALEAAGARHEYIEGYGHRIQDSPDFEALVHDFWSSLDSESGNYNGLSRA